ncbi:ABC transporter permease [Yinghuangia seranimata]|uniref:ABC transporter permease n=1 Tax=Yinghuangia seranimata TaxID=408067 RepID=UPI00248ACE60|nr:ABC-2 family transporter protein [Yinghuangia seranimata]MDI2132134.1 ABC-2 family transporter protein [Yinghuangia seranimata]
MPFAAACPKSAPDPHSAPDPSADPPDRRGRPRPPARRRAADAAAGFVALTGAGFRRYATYRQAMVAGLFTNIVFGAMLASIMLGVAADGRTPGGYSREQLVAFVWVGQGLLNVVYTWGWRELADRVRSGDVTADLLRPVDPLTSYAAADLGRAGQAVLGRWIAPVVVGVAFYDIYVPHRPSTYVLFVVSVVLATLVSFGGRYLVNLSAFWLLDVRGPVALWMLAGALLSGSFLPMRFLPEWVQWLLWCGTPFPSIFQIPLDVAVERTDGALSATTVLLQLVWVIVLFLACRAVQRRAVRRLVVQGG